MPASALQPRQSASLALWMAEPRAERPEEVDCYEPGFREKEAEKALRKAPEVPPNVEFVERVRQAAWAWHQLEQNKHGMLVRQFYNRR